MNSQGVIYVAVGDEYVEQAVRSAKSLKACNKLEVHLVVPGNQCSLLEYVDLGTFDNVTRIEETEPHIAKIKAISASPFQRTVFLDADTFVCKSIMDVFDVLNGVHIAGVGQLAYQKQADLPDAFPEINTGFLVYEECPEIKNLFERWLEIADITGKGKIKDQWAFRKALFQVGDVRFAVLPQQYNFLLGSMNVAIGAVKVLHGSKVDFESVAKAINARGSARIWLPSEAAVVDSRHLWEVSIDADGFERRSWKT